MRPLVSYAQMTHSRRAIGAKLVRDQLGRSVDVHIDHIGAGPWPPARRAWQATPASCAWRVLLQDDVELAPDFADVLEYYLEAYADRIAGRPLMLYNGLRDQPAAGEHWIERLDGVQGPAIVLAAADVRPMLAWLDVHVRHDSPMTSSDIRPSLWLEAMGRTSLCPSPSWIQHKGWEPSLNGTRSTRSQPRTAPTYEGRSLTLYDWRRGLSRPSARAGMPLGASTRVRWHLWRTWQDKADYELEAAGIDPRSGAPAWPPTKDGAAEATP